MTALALFGDSVTTDHISPAGAFKADSPAGKYLLSLGVKERDFNSYGSRRGNHHVMVRGTLQMFVCATKWPMERRRLLQNCSRKKDHAHL